MTLAEDVDVDAAFDVIFAPPEGAIEIAPGLYATADFSVWFPDKGEKRSGRPNRNTEVLRARDNPSYGVTVLFWRNPGSQGGEVRYRETLTLPAEADWPTEGDPQLPKSVRPRITVSVDRRTGVTEQTVTLALGQLIPSFQGDDGLYILSPFPVHEWGLYEDDPPGDWIIEASINDKPVIRKAFKVVAD
ncbi:MAG: hypothetical protein M3478_12195 [Planctomycetota bacterium]|nr:hypothetical protein [Planctomycetota bacterium]